MLLYNRRFFLLMTAGLASGCDFVPTNGAGSQVNELQNAVMLRAPNNENEFAFIKAVEDRLGHATTHEFDLAYSIRISNDSVSVTTAQSQRRISLRGTLTYTLTRADGAPVARGSERSFTSYSTSGSNIATQTARKDANERLMNILADQLIISLSSQLRS